HGAVEADEREVRAVGVGLDAVGDGAAAVLVQAADAEGQPAAGDAVLGGEDPGRRDDRGRAGLPAGGEQARGPGTAGGVTAADDGLGSLGGRGRRGLGRGGGRAEECEDGDRGGGERGNEPGYAQGFLDSTCTQGDACALWGTRPGEEHRTAPHPNSGP